MARRAELEIGSGAVESTILLVVTKDSGGPSNEEDVLSAWGLVKLAPSLPSFSSSNPPQYPQLELFFTITSPPPPPLPMSPTLEDSQGL